MPWVTITDPDHLQSLYLHADDEGWVRLAGWPVTASDHPDHGSSWIGDRLMADQLVEALRQDYGDQWVATRARWIGGARREFEVRIVGPEHPDAGLPPGAVPAAAVAWTWAGIASVLRAWLPWVLGGTLGVIAAFEFVLLRLFIADDSGLLEPPPGGSGSDVRSDLISALAMVAVIVAVGLAGLVWLGGAGRA